MSDKVFFVSIVTALLVIVVTGFFFKEFLRVTSSSKMKFSTDKDSPTSYKDPSKLSQNLAAALPGSVLLPNNGMAFRQSAEHHWAQQESQVVPACIVRPRNIQELCTAVKILDQARGGGEGSEDGFFAVRSGGHSWVTGASSINGGTLIDLCLFSDVEVYEETSTAVIGTGARWGDVSKILEKKNLAVLGGRNSDVGVGGFLLGGGVSFFSPRFGLACSNVLKYEVVLASGEVVTATESTRPDLWRALKGGANNFGIVTRFTVRCFPQDKFWGGYLYLPSFQDKKVLSLFHDFLRKTDQVKQGTSYGENAAGPLTAFSYVQPVHMEITTIHLAYTEGLGIGKGWPSYWKSSPFASLWRYWSTVKTRTLTNATEELEALNTRGKRQQQTTSTIKNDLATLTAAYAIYQEGIAALRRAGVKGLIWTLVIQPLSPDWFRKGDPNPMGLHNCGDDPLVLLLYVAVWEHKKDDEVVRDRVWQSIERLEAIAAANGTSHPYKYLNYCGDGQKPFQSYGEEGLQFLRQVSQKYDPKSMFQKQCIGGFKLEMDTES